MNARHRLARFLGLTLGVLGSISVGCGGGESTSAEPDPMHVPDPSDPVPNAGCSIDTGIPNVEVILHDDSGAVVDVKDADAEGIAAWDSCPDSAMMSFAAADDGGVRGTTVTGIEPGDHFAVGHRGLGVVGSADVEVPEDVAELTNVRVSAGPGCSGKSAEGATKSLLLTSACVRTADGKLPVLATADNGDSHYYSYSKEATLDMEGMVVSDMSTWSVGPYVPVAVENASGPGVVLLVTNLRNGIPYQHESEGVVLIDGEAGVSLSAPPSSFVTSRRYAAIIPTASSHEGVVLHSTSFGATLDGSEIPAPISETELLDADGNRPTLRLSGGPEGAQLTVRVMTWMAQDQDVDWMVVAPASQELITFPALPEHLAALAPVNMSYTGALAIDVEGASYRSILTEGYVMGQFHACPALADGGLCRFSIVEP